MITLVWITLWIRAINACIMTLIELSQDIIEEEAELFSVSHPKSVSFKKHLLKWELAALE